MQSVANAYSDAGNAFHCGVWEGEVGAWRVAYTEHEFCHMLVGRVRMRGDDGSDVTVAVAPMFTGSGQLLKVLEAMASGAPVVATTRALNGLEARHDEHVLVADDPESFARAVLTLLEDPARAARLATAARQLVESSCTWEHTVADLEQHYTRALQAAAIDSAPRSEPPRPDASASVA